MEATTKVKIRRTSPKDTGALLNQPNVKAAKASDVRNPWLCLNCGSILGSIYTEKIRAGLSLSRLIVFRMAVRVGELLPENLIFAKIDAGEIGCSRCGEVRVFHPSPNLIKHYLSAPGKKKNRNVP